MLRVALFPSDETGCGMYRMRWPAEAAAASGEVEVMFPPFSRRVLSQIASGRIPVDVVVFQRPLHGVIAEFIAPIQAQGVAVVVDLDDDLAAAHPQGQIFRAVHPSNVEHNWHHVRRACKLADVVTVTTPVLAERYGGQKARVLPNFVPEWLLDVTAPRDGCTIGWGGFTGTHIDDLKVTHGGVAQAVADTGARFLQVGPPEGVREDLLLAEMDTTGGVAFGEYHQALAQLDVTIAPLADSRFNRAKSGLKVLEAAALGIPCVASPRPEYERLARLGLCVIAQDRARDWRRRCRALLEDPQDRADRGRYTRQVVREGLTYKTNGWRWAQVWSEAVDRRRRAARPPTPYGKAILRQPVGV